MSWILKSSDRKFHLCLERGYKWVGTAWPAFYLRGTLEVFRFLRGIDEYHTLLLLHRDSYEVSSVKFEKLDSFSLVGRSKCP